MRHVSFASVSVLALSFALASCSSSKTDTPANTSTVTGTITKDIGPEGGIIEVDGATVTFPKGALAANKTITIRAKSGGGPTGFTVLSRVFECEPTGTTFAQPVTMQMPFKDNGKGNATMFWSTAEDPTFKDVGGRVEGTTMVATVLHFSSGFVAEKATTAPPTTTSTAPAPTTTATTKPGGW